MQFAGENIAVRPPREEDRPSCHAVKLFLAESTWFGIDSDEMKWAYVVWSSSSVPVKPISPRNEGEVPEGALVVRSVEGGGLTVERKGNIAIGPVPENPQPKSLSHLSQ